MSGTRVEDAAALVCGAESVADVVVTTAGGAGGIGPDGLLKIQRRSWHRVTTVPRRAE